MIHVFFFSGFAANGKSSLIQSIEGFVPKEHTVVKIGESARDVFELNKFLFGKCDPEEFEKQILASEYYMLQLLGDLAEKDNYDDKNHLVILKDRFILDVLCFMLIKKQISFEKACELCEKYFSEHVSKILGIFHGSNYILLINGTENEEFIKKAMQDPTRKETITDFLTMQKKFYRFWWKLADVLNLSRKLDIVQFSHPTDDPMVPFKIVGFILNEMKYG